MEWIADPTIWIGLATLVVLEIVLGIDNLVFIAILADKLPPHQRDHARLTGLSLALIMRLALLASISWLVTLTAPLVTIYGFSVSGRDLIMLGGGIFLLAKATMELHERLEPPHESRNTAKVHAGFWLIVTQIIILDAVFSIDSVVTAVGMVDSLPVMMAAVIIAILVMMLASKPLTTFVNAHPTVVVLCLGFLMMIGFSLIADGFGFHIPKGYLYAAIGFSILIEAFNQWTQRNRAKQVAAMPFRQRTAEAIFRLLGGSVEDGEAGSGNGATEAEGARLRRRRTQHGQRRFDAGRAACQFDHDAAARDCLGVACRSIRRSCSTFCATRRTGFIRCAGQVLTISSAMRAPRI